MGPTRTERIGGKRYILVMVDDFSRYSIVGFLREKSETVDFLTVKCRTLQNQHGATINRFRSDNGTEFKESGVIAFCNEIGIKHEFSAVRTPQQNGIVERKNRTIQEMARSMLLGRNVPRRFWAEAVNTACHTVNRVYLRPNTNKTPYELWMGKKPNLSYFRVFGSPCYILRDRELLGKFDIRSDEGIFLGYSQHSRAFRVFNLSSPKVMESFNVVIKMMLRPHQLIMRKICRVSVMLCQMVKVLNHKMTWLFQLLRKRILLLGCVRVMIH